jgi:hypothetical protein
MLRSYPPQFDPAVITRIRVEGRFDAGAGKPQNPTISPEGIVSCTGPLGTTVSIDLTHRPTVTQIESSPYPVDMVNTFFVPSTAITCVVRGTQVECVGKFDRRSKSIRIDAVDQENHSALWVGITMA